MEEQRYMIEELVLGLADIVNENRYLRKENARLKEYHQSIIDRCRASEEASLNMLRDACVSIAQGKIDMELAKELANYMQPLNNDFLSKQ